MAQALPTVPARAISHSVNPCDNGQVFDEMLYLRTKASLEADSYKRALGRTLANEGLQRS
jgi:hypothetical protein